MINSQELRTGNFWAILREREGEGHRWASVTVTFINSKKIGNGIGNFQLINSEK